MMDNRDKTDGSWRLIYEDADLLVVCKPAGMPVQSAALGVLDLESVLKTYLRASAGNRQGNPPYLGIIHRLDQPVEGLVVFAKNQKAAASLSSQAADGRMEKRYLAGIVRPDLRDSRKGRNEAAGARGELTDWLLRDGRTNTSRVVPPGTKGAKQAILSYEFIRDDVVRIKLETGRHHQIRVQMANAGWPLRGDRKYGTGNAKEQRRFPALCAYALSFDHPSDGRRMSFSLPEEEVAARIGGSPSAGSSAGSGGSGSFVRSETCKDRN